MGLLSPFTCLFSSLSFGTMPSLSTLFSLFVAPMSCGIWYTAGAGGLLPAAVVVDLIDVRYAQELALWLVNP